ncbi:MAG: hypothetical protein FWG81_05220 [Betaproteobacteria bacterium]|nr:hypothetical protein [Betaproteobacteria bacterium]
MPNQLISADDQAREQFGMIRKWLDRWQDETPDLKEMDRLLRKLQDAHLPPAMFRNSLELLFGCLAQHLPALVRKIVGVRVPIGRRQREEIASLQTTLNNFALAYEWLQDNLAGIDFVPKEEHFIAERIAFCLVHSIYIAYLVAAPVEYGLWLRLHRAGLRDVSGQYLPASYRLAILLTAVQPVSFASRELAQLLLTLAKYVDEVRLHVIPPIQPKKMEKIFWLAPKRDFPLFAMNRREPLPEEPVFYFDGAYIAAKIMTESDLEKVGESKYEKRLRKSILQRASEAIGSPGKRCFQRRKRQFEAHRATVHIGLEACWAQLLHERGLAEKSGIEVRESSKWMIVNESPNGYALMLLDGKVGSVRAGDAVALRIETEKDWLICLARWVQSDNPEHLEMGLQLISLEAIPAMIQPRPENRERKVPLLLLPEHPPLRKASALLAPSGALMNGGYCLWLPVGDAGEERVVFLLESEQNSRVELFMIAP